MKKNLNVYTMRLIKDHLIYIIFFLVTVLMSVYFIPLYVKNLRELRQRQENVNLEISKMKKRKQTVLSFSPAQIDYMLQTLNRLVPETEDYFSLFNSLEVLERKTGFIITSYRAALTESKKDRLTLTINGEGSLDSVLNFLRVYRLGGGRLITIDKIDFLPARSKVSLTINFYAKKIKVESDQFGEIDPALVRFIEKSAANGQTQVQVPIDSTYATSDNPFQ